MNQDKIIIKNAITNNLKNISIEIPKNKIINAIKSYENKRKKSKINNHKK